MNEKILTKLEHNIPKSLTQNEIETFVMGKVLEHGKSRGYCYLVSLLYGLEEIGPNSIDDLVGMLKHLDPGTDYFDKETGAVGWADGLARLITKDKNGLKRFTVSPSLDVIRNLAYNSRPIDKLFLLVHTPGHYSYCRMDGTYSNPLGEKSLDPERVIHWELWKVI